MLPLQAYQVLHHGGIKDDNIVVMMADDIAGNYQNPHPGKIFNSPGGPDVYEGVPVVSAVSRMHFPGCQQPQRPRGARWVCKLSWVEHWQASCTCVAAGGIWHRQAALAVASVHEQCLGPAGMVTRSL